MIRRLALILALLCPVAGLAQAAGEVLVLPQALGIADCSASDKFVNISWMTTLAPTTGDVYRVYVNTTGCSSSAMTTGQLGSDITPESTSATTPQVYQSPPTRMDFLINTAGITDCSVAGPTIKVYVCVQQVTITGSVLRATMNGSAQLYRVAPPVPVNVRVASGDSALYVSWDVNPVGTGVAAASYDVTAVADTPANPSDTQTQSFTGTANNRVSGLTNGVTYKVTVKSVSPGSNSSAASVEALGTPAPVSDFWDAYKTEDHGREVGGCGGGPAGLVSLLGVALALRGLRRKS
jgi:hypothetical protein